MFEVEIKAWVDDVESVKKNLDSFATYIGSVTRDDKYWGAPGKKKIRVRREKSDGGEKIILTYKKKEKRIENGAAIEVNDEKECELSDALPLESFLADNGFEIRLEKHKDVMDWSCPVEKVQGLDDSLDATLELCHVPPLGHFLEIEILSPTNNPDVTDKLREQLVNLIEKSGIPQSRIEQRYYSELLKSFNG